MSSRKFSQLQRAVITKTVYKKLWWQQASCAGTSLPLKQFQCQSLQLKCLLPPNETMGAEQKVLLELLQANKHEREKPWARSMDHKLLQTSREPETLAARWAPRSVLPDVGSVPRVASRQPATRAPLSSTEAKRYAELVSIRPQWRLLYILQGTEREKNNGWAMQGLVHTRKAARGNGEAQESAGRKWCFV